MTSTAVITSSAGSPPPDPPNLAGRTTRAGPAPTDAAAGNTSGAPGLFTLDPLDFGGRSSWNSRTGRM